MDYLPLFFDIKNQRCLLVGGGVVALRKARLLARAGACIEVVSLTCLPELEHLLREGLHSDQVGVLKLRAFEAADVQDKRLIVCATDNESLNQEVAALAHQHHIPVNVVDKPQLCSFIFPAIVDRSPIVVAVSSGGQSPVLARHVRNHIETLLPHSYKRLASFVGDWRDTVKTRMQSYKNTGELIRRFWESVIMGPVAELIMAGKTDEAKLRMEKALEQEQVLKGEVYLVGAGPGDPELLTFKAHRLMQKAEVVLYDRLVSPAVMDLLRKDAELIYVGKAKSNHAVPQAEINQLLLELAQQGKRVLRLKGGDPFIFGRGGEEIELLAEHQIPFQVVPGITAASGCAAYAGIPLTHRDYAQSVRFLTAHFKGEEYELDWPSLLEPSQTLVFYMGLSGLERICKQLMAYGRDPKTPMALVQSGTTPEHKTYTATLGSMVKCLENEQVKAPTLIILGDVVSLQQSLNWFSAKL